MPVSRDMSRDATGQSSQAPAATTSEKCSRSEVGARPSTLSCATPSRWTVGETPPEVVTKCLDSLDVPDNEPIAVVLMGGGMIGQMMGAEVEAIKRGMQRSKKQVVVYSL